MATIARIAQLGNATVAFMFDDVAMKLTQVTLANTSGQVLRLTMIAPLTFSVTMLPAQSTAHPIAAVDQPAYTLDAKGNVQGIEWQATLGN